NGDMNLPQPSEIPCPNTLAKNGSQFRLIAHNPAAKKAIEIAADTDIDITLTAQADEAGLCLYARRSTPRQRLVLRSEYLGHVEHTIRKTVLLQRYVGEPAY